MNEQQEIFTAEQFRAQAVELSQAMAELQRRDSKTIDPHDPFENETEFHDYQPDYTEIVPQIRIPGCRIPLRANAREKGRIHRFNNIVGGLLLLHLVLSNGFAIGLEGLVLWLLRLTDGMSTAELPANYSDIAYDYFWNSSSMTAMNLLAFGIMNVLIVMIGCRVTKLPVANFFRTHNFHAGTAIGYIAIGLLIQLTMGYAATGLTDLFKGVDITLYEPSDTVTTELKAVVLSFIYSVLVAPVTEELLMRGFVLKNLSRVSQRFGIIASAFLFGIWHENVAQFLLAFVGGIFFGYIAVKHNSLIPSIICHMAVNCFAEVFTICEDFGWETADFVIGIIYFVLAFVGLILLIRMLIVERFPQTTPRQAERTLRQALASPLLVAAVICHLAVAVLAIVSSSK